MLRGADANNLTGIPAAHGAVFQAVANKTQCMISSRAVGKYATGLIEESYASKGFHNKAKSCNWGPMAGFVLADPRFTKAPDVQGQAKSLLDAEHHGAKEVPVIVSDLRRQWLLTQHCMTPVLQKVYTHLYTAASPQGPLMYFVLKKSTTVPHANGAEMWAVHYGITESKVDFHDTSKVESAELGADYLPVMAMRDPMCTVDAADYRSATTGDYDLFALYAKAANYRPDTHDKRMVSHQALESNIKAKLKDTGEDEHMGNLTPRILEIRNLLNQGFVQTGYTGGNMVHHSDEGGRPFVGDIDLPVFAVVPGEARPYALTSVEDLRQFIRAELEGYAPMFNPGWMRQLVFHSDVKVAKSIRDELMAKAAKRRL